MYKAKPVVPFPTCFIPVFPFLTKGKGKFIFLVTQPTNLGVFVVSSFSLTSHTQVHSKSQGIYFQNVSRIFLLLITIHHYPSRNHLSPELLQEL